MPTLDELQGASGSLHDALAAGIADISQQTTVSFTVYQKVVLPLDGYVYWLRTGSFEQAGAIHFSAERQQEETETRGRNSVIFTTQELVQDLNTEDTQTLAVGDVGGQLYAFGRHGWFFPQAGVFHYQGDGVPASMSEHLVDDPSQIDPTKLIVSDSLPAWLQLVSYDPVWVSWPIERNPHITLYPSYLVPDNLTPPYGVVHIEPSRIEALQSTAMWTTPTYSHYQLTRESVRVTLYGCNNEKAADFLDLVEQYTLDTDAFGLMNMPTIRDGKRPWSEGMIIAQLKTIDFEVSYVQTRINDVARQLITSAIATVLPFDFARTTGALRGQAATRAGLLPISASSGARIDGGGDLQATTRANIASISQRFDGAAGMAARANGIISTIAAASGARAGISSVLAVQSISLVGKVDAAAGISARCSVLTAVVGKTDASATVLGAVFRQARLATTLAGSVSTTSGTIGALISYGAEADAAAGISSRAKTTETLAGEIDVASGVAAWADHIIVAGGASHWFTSSKIDSAGGTVNTPVTRDTVSAASSATAGISCNVRVVTAVLGRITSAGSTAGAATILGH